jgi:hypothetical protein
MTVALCLIGSEAVDPTTHHLGPAKSTRPLCHPITILSSIDYPIQPSGGTRYPESHGARIVTVDPTDLLSLSTVLALAIQNGPFESGPSHEASPHAQSV